MKRIVSYLLAAVLVLGPCMSSYATEPDRTQESTEPAKGQETENVGGEASSTGGEQQSTETQQDTDMQQDADKEQDADVQQDVDKEQDAGTLPVSGEEDTDENADESRQTEEASKDKGQVDVYIAQTLEWGSAVTFTVSLEGSEKKITLASAEDGEVQKGVTFGDLAAGTYNLKVSAPGFSDYTQQIKVEGWAYKVNLATGFLGGYGYTPEGIHPGVLLIGDVNGDRMITEEDETLLVDLIDAGEAVSGHEAADLNRDGKLDLTDLEYFAQGYKVEQDTVSFVELHVPGSAISQKAGDQTAADGALANLSTGEGSVTLKRADGAEISANTPVTLEFDIPQGESFPTGGIVIDSGEENPIRTASMDITYMDENAEHTITVSVAPEGVAQLLTAENVQVSSDGYGKILINLGNQVAVKKVTLRITGMKKNNNLAEISKVEFVNDMEKRIPEPQRDIPKNLKAEAGNKKFTLEWEACSNVTGYEVLIEDENKEQEIMAAKGPMLSVTSFGKDKLVNGKEYKVQVQSVNGAWRSGYCEPITVIPKADKVPAAPDSLKLTGGYRAIVASWKRMEDTDSYNLFYREEGAEGYTKVEGITANNYTIADLKDKTAYEVYVTGVNELGESKPSLTAKAETIDPDPAQMPKYKLINVAGEGEVSGHITGASIAKGTMQDSPLDEQAGTAWGTVDNNPISHYVFSSWDGGGYNALTNHGVTYEFDQAYEMDRIALQEVTPQSQHYGYVQVRYWDENGNEVLLDNSKVGIQRKTDSENRAYYLIKFQGPIKAKKIQFGLARSYVYGTISISEVYFYQYDPIEADIMALYQDDLHTVLREDVTQDTIDGLRARINTPDEVSGEYHPDKTYLERELKTAEDILNSKLTESVRIYNAITTQDLNVGRGFGGLNAWQPIGATAAAGEEITVYVGHNTKRTGENTNLQLVSTQYHAESDGLAKVVATLKVGRNDITIPKISSTNVESGGALYVQYTGNRADDDYAVRVSGGVQVPRLDLYQVSDPAERLSRAAAYIGQLDEYVNGMEARHEEAHKNSENDGVAGHDFDPQNCILGAADIMLDTMLLSLPAKQIRDGAGGGSIEERAQKLVTSMDAMEGMMGLFYQHKGLNNSAPEVKDRIPATHLNIRYQRMFAGAFMYAAGNHIGIEWPETKGMMGGVPVQSDENGKYVSGGYFGWGIAHEIGHCINQGAYAYAEVTNNYYSVLAQAKDTNDSVRFQYSNVYDKVTSGTKGNASNVFTQLGMYWQLHLAYDDGMNFKTYPAYDQQLNSLFFARVDTYARTPAKAPAPGGVALTLSGDSDQKLMRLSCAAAQKNILEFFERWGKTPDQDTVKYAEQFPKETRAIYYVDDNSRVYRTAGSGSILGTEGKIEAVGDGTAAVLDANAANRVDITLSSKNINTDDILGYEIVRCMISNGDVEKEPVGFTTGNQFTDVVTTINNRVITYEITLIDKYLNRSAVKTLPALKISHNGEIGKEDWTVSTKNITATNVPSAGIGNDDTPCGPEVEAAIKKAVDNDLNTEFTGTVNENAEVLIEFNRPLMISGFRYRAGSEDPVKEYVIYVKNEEDNSWAEAAKGSFASEDERMVHFGKEGSDNIVLYRTSAVKLAITGQTGEEISIAELDVLGVTGDNVEFRYMQDGDAQKTPVIGRLQNDHQYGEEAKDTIPKGSIVFTGRYKGNAAYNVVILYDQDGNIVGGTDEDGSLKAEQVIYTEDPQDEEIQDTYDGTWMYWITPKSAEEEAAFLESLKQVRAELYRVDNALTNEGQRLVSDTKFETMPAELPDIQLDGK